MTHGVELLHEGTYFRLRRDVEFLEILRFPRKKFLESSLKMRKSRYIYIKGLKTAYEGIEDFRR